MGMFTQLRALCRMPSADPEVMISQISAFSKQVPLLYVIGNANSIALAYTHFDTAPKLLTLLVPIPILIVCLIRVFIWYRTRHETFTAAQALTRLRSTVAISGVLGCLYATWAICLYPYGNAYAQCHVIFFLATTVIGMIFCLMHLRSAALLLTAVVTLPFMVRFLTTGQRVLTAMAVDFLLIVVVMVFILSRYYKDFVDLVHSKTTLAALSDENFRMANLDSLTGLPNRRSFFANLTTIFDGDASVFALRLVDLDGFKPVNDVFGHAAGDAVLVEVGRRLRAALGPDVLVARLGGDEFGLLLPVPPGALDVPEQGAAICRDIQRPIQFQTGVARVAASIGFAVRSEGTSTWQQLIERADYALYHAKATQRGTAVLFSAQHESAIHLKSLLEQELRRADFAAEMSMKFQPIVDVGTQRTQRTIAYEALARWKSPLLGDVAPMDFIAAAERMGLITQLTEILFAKALAAMKTWPEDIDLSFNLSVRDLACRDSIARLRTILETSGIPARRIAFEVTETALISDFDQMRDMLVCLKALGAKISLDDFGTGFSSLSYVHRLPLDKIKVDRTFVSDITTNMTSRDIVKSILDLCRNLMISCIVEGVETPEQVLILRALGCTTMQGYYFGRPANNEDLPANSTPASEHPIMFNVAVA